MKKLQHLVLLFLMLCCADLRAFEYNRVAAGSIKGARLSWVSTNAIKISVGYGEIMGSYWEIVAADPLNSSGYTLTNLTPTTTGVFHYIYIDRSNSSLPAVALRNSTIAPSWSDDFLGWYDGTDRCIGAVWVKANGELANFFCSTDSTYHVNLPYFYTGTSITTTYAFTSFDGSPYIPVNAYEANLRLVIGSTGSAWPYCRAGLMGIGGSAYYDTGSYNALVSAWIEFPRANKTFWFMPHATHTSGTASINLGGYRLER